MDTYGLATHVASYNAVSLRLVRQSSGRRSLIVGPKISQVH